MVTRQANHRIDDSAIRVLVIRTSSKGELAAFNVHHFLPGLHPTMRFEPAGGAEDFCLPTPTAGLTNSSAPSFLAYMALAHRDSHSLDQPIP